MAVATSAKTASICVTPRKPAMGVGDVLRLVRVSAVRAGRGIPVMSAPHSCPLTRCRRRLRPRPFIGTSAVKRAVGAQLVTAMAGASLMQHAHVTSCIQAMHAQFAPRGWLECTANSPVLPPANVRAGARVLAMARVRVRSSSTAPTVQSVLAHSLDPSASSSAHLPCAE